MVAGSAMPTEPREAIETNAAPASIAARTACSRCLALSNGSSSISLTPTGSAAATTAAMSAANSCTRPDSR